MTDTQQYPPLTVGTVLLTFATGTGMLLAALDANIVGTAMPTIVASLGGLDLFSWVFSLYALVSTAALPIFGRLSDVYGRKKLYLGGLAIFVLASILCGTSQSMPQLNRFPCLAGTRWRCHIRPDVCNRRRPAPARTQRTVPGSYRFDVGYLGGGWAGTGRADH